MQNFDLDSIFQAAMAPQQDALPPDLQLLAAMSECGIPTDGLSIAFDGKIKRFGKNKNCWYVGHELDGFFVGGFGDWAADISEAWQQDVKGELSALELMAIRQAQEAAKAKAKTEQAKLNQEAAAAAAQRWDGAIPAPNQHPYLQAKGVRSYGLRMDASTGELLVLVSGAAGIQSLQSIQPGGEKRFIFGGAMKGGFYKIEGVGAIHYVAEGYATAASIHAATGAPVWVTFSANNIKNITPLAAAAAQSVVVVADNDASGTGERCALEAVEGIVGAKVVLVPVVGMDANDYAEAGHDLGALLGHQHIEEKGDWLETFDESWLDQPQATDWLVRHWLPAGAFGMLHGASGVGKSFVGLDLAMCVATGQEWRGCKVKQGQVAILAGEGFSGIKKRVAGWLQKNSKRSAAISVSRGAVDLNTAEGLGKVVTYLDELAKSGPIKMVQIDTLHRFMFGDENSAQDAKGLIDSCADIQQRYGCVVLLVHHTGTSDTAKHRARGSSAWRGALDFEIGLSEEDGSGKVLQAFKMKDDELPAPIGVSFEVLEIAGWKDEEGEPVTTVVLNYEAVEAKQQAAKLDKKEQWLVRAFDDFLDAWQHAGCERDSLGRPIISKAAAERWGEDRGWKPRTIQNKLSTSDTSGSGCTMGLLIEAKQVRFEMKTYTFIADEAFRFGDLAKGEAG